MNLPSKTQAIEIMTTHDLTTLSLDGVAYLRSENPELLDLLTGMVSLKKIDAANLTGAMMLLGLMLQTP